MVAVISATANRPTRECLGNQTPEFAREEKSSLPVKAKLNKIHDKEFKMKQAKCVVVLFFLGVTGLVSSPILDRKTAAPVCSAS